MEKTKKKKWPKVVIGVLAFFIIVGALGSNSDKSPGKTADSTNAPKTDASAVDTIAPQTPVSEPATPKTQAVEMQLTSGHYTAGIDFPAGTYDIEAVAGGGNVSSSNMYTGGLNAIMGVDDGTGMYEQSYANIKLPVNTVLSVSGATIKITCPDASGDALTPRSQNITETVSLGNGNFTAGTDFPAGIYDVAVASGSGNVSTSNMYEGGLNEIMGADDGTGMYTQAFNHVTLTDGVDVSISGVKITLTPSK